MINVLFNLEWVVSYFMMTANFLNLTISINENDNINFSLCSKSFHPSQHILPHSAYPPGLLKAMVQGMLLLCWEYSTFIITF